MKLRAPHCCSAQFVTRFISKLNIAGVAIAILATICCGTNASAEDVSGRVLSPQRIRSITSAIDGEAIIANAKTTKDWLSYGLDYSETRYSKLSQINTESVKNLGLILIDLIVKSKRENKQQAPDHQRDETWRLLRHLR